MNKDTRLEELGLSVRPFNILYRNGIRTLGQLCNKTEKEVCNIRYMGRHSFQEIQEKLAEHNLRLRGMDEDIRTDNWHPISDGLPPIGIPLIVTIKDNLEGKPNELRYPVYYEKDSRRGGYHWSWRFGEFDYELIPNISKVVAFMKLPEIYKEEVE